MTYKYGKCGGTIIIIIFNVFIIICFKQLRSIKYIILGPKSKVASELALFILKCSHEGMRHTQNDFMHNA